MDTSTKGRLVEFLNASLNPNGDISILAVSIADLGQSEQADGVLFQVRIAITFREADGLCPYFDGTDLFLAISETNMRFVCEGKWSDGPPLVEGSPIELALNWVSELGPPIFAVTEILNTVTKPNANDREAHRNVLTDDFDTYF